MKITLEWLKEKRACAEAVAAFTEKFGEEAEYQSVLDEAAKLEHQDWASWLLNTAGPTDAVLKIDGDLTAENVSTEQLAELEATISK